jgi:transcriptional regulator with PAS, ATPase and Fis domain
MGGVMEEHNLWVEEFPGAIMVCDTQGIILEMNRKAAETYKSDGGLALIGTNVLDCHPEPARTKLRQLMDKQQINAYTIEKGGVKKLVYQAPWFVDGQYRGFMELAFEIPAVLPHFVRDKPPVPASKP